MYRRIKKYIVTLIIVVCLFVSCIDLMWIGWGKMLKDNKYVKRTKNTHKEQSLSKGKYQDYRWEKKEDEKYVKPIKNIQVEQYQVEDKEQNYREKNTERPTMEHQNLIPPRVEKEQNYREKIPEKPTIEHQKERQKKHIKNVNIIRTEHIVHTNTTTEKTTTSDNLVLIDYFKQFYRYSLNPQPGSAGMEGAGVKNSVNEKPLEDIGFKNYSFNQLSSSKISLERSVPDNRNDA